MTTNTTISNLVSSQVPFFVKNDHQNFIRFLEAYYEYLEQPDETIDVIKNIKNYRDIDMSVDVFADKMFDTFTRLLPTDIKADRNMVLKNIKDFYRSKGSENAIRFLMHIIYGHEVNFYYPGRDILKASDAKWFIEKSIRVGDVKVQGVANTNLGALQKFKNTRIVGNTSNALAVVENVDSFFENGVIVNELKLSSQENDFSSGEEIFAYFDEEGQAKTITGTIFSGIISDTTLIYGGAGYEVGDPVIIESNTGSGAVVQVGTVTRGRLKTVDVLLKGAGFQNNDFLLISGPTGSGANANVLAVSADSYYHPNSYSIPTSLISLEANTAIGNLVYTNLNSSNVNTALVNAFSFFTYANTGPVERVRILLSGDGYLSIPNLDIVSNTRVRSLGILGRMEIVNGGLNYAIGDAIEFQNRTIDGRLVLGTGAAANVVNVAANGKITKVQFQPVSGHYTGGSGYAQADLPKANVISGTGNGANIVVTSILGDGELLQGNTDSIGIITSLHIVNRGLGYTTPPTLNLANSGDGTANATATIITGIYTYPGRYVSDDGIISGFNFLQSRDYYQNYSYVIRVKESINKYRKAIKDLAHPAGMKLFGEYDIEDKTQATQMPGASSSGQTLSTKYVNGTYMANLGNVVVNTNGHGLVANDSIYLEFISGDTINISNGLFIVRTSNANSFFIPHPNTKNTSGSVYAGIIFYGTN
jgi:hypothetical protein